MDIKRYFRNGSGREIFPIGESNKFSCNEDKDKHREQVITTIRPGLSGIPGNSETYIIPVLTPNRLIKRQNGRRFKEAGEPSFTLTGQDIHGVMIKNKIRSLTPTECERLQGFPDDWTKYGLYDGEVKQVSDTQRYKMCGNAVSVPVVKTIATKLKTT